jgi:glyoxylase-like metal-dependent hydrolase (beta-lactamase superfamily II)
MLYGMFPRTPALLLPLMAMLTAGSPASAQGLRLYVFDNGVLQGLDPSSFHFRKEEIAVADMACASYLIVHPKGTLLWDSGVIPDSAIEAGQGEQKRGATTIKATKTLKSQLAEAGFAPKDITYFALSHDHFDHTANANEFAGSTWLVQQPERDSMFSDKPGPATVVAPYAALRNSKTQILHGEDYDVFGDGTVVIKAAYGHTPGHQVLYLKLPRTGPIVLAGDLYHYQEERGTDKVPTFEFSRDQSLASRASIEALIKRSGAQLWIEHDLANFTRQKKAPAYYD